MLLGRGVLIRSRAVVRSYVVVRGLKGAGHSRVRRAGGKAENISLGPVGGKASLTFNGERVLTGMKWRVSLRRKFIIPKHCKAFSR